MAPSVRSINRSDGVEVAVAVSSVSASESDVGVILTHGAGGDKLCLSMRPPTGGLLVVAVECRRTLFPEAYTHQLLTKRPCTGGDMNSGNLPTYAEAFASAGIPCVRMNHPRNVPGGQKSMQAVLDHSGPGFPVVKGWVLAGHSMGCRIAAEVAHVNSEKDQLRDAPLQRLHQPILFVRGTRDAFCDTGKFTALLPTIPSKAVKVHTVEGGDHSLNVKGGKAVTAEARARLITAAVKFVQSIAGGEGSGSAAGKAGAKQPPGKADDDGLQPPKKRSKRST